MFRLIVHGLLVLAVLLPGCHFFSQDRPAPWVGSEDGTKLGRWADRHPKIIGTMALTGLAVGVTVGAVAVGALYVADAIAEGNADTPPPKKKK